MTSGQHRDRVFRAGLCGDGQGRGRVGGFRKLLGLKHEPPRVFLMLMVPFTLLTSVVINNTINVLSVFRNFSLFSSQVVSKAFLICWGGPSVADTHKRQKG